MTHRRRDLLIDLGLTALFLFCRRYEFGGRDHAIHLGYIERAAEPGFLPGDPMLDVAAQHASLYFHTLAHLGRVVPLEVVFAVGYALAVFAMFAGLRSLARHLWPGAGGAWAAAFAVAAAFVHRQVGGSIGNFDPLLLPRVISLGPLLYALSLGVRGRFHRAFGLAGLVVLFHATSAAQAAFLVWCVCAAGGRRNLRPLVLGPVVFLALAAPLWIPLLLRGGPGIPTPAPDTWIRSVKLHFPFHHFESMPGYLRAVLPAVMAILLAMAVGRREGANRRLTGLLLGGAGLVVAGWVGNRLLASPITIHLHLFQVARFFDYLAVAALGRWLYDATRGPVPVAVVAALVAVSYVARDLLIQLLGGRTHLEFGLLGAALIVTWLLRRRGLPGAEHAEPRSPPPALRRVFVVLVVVGLALSTAIGRIPRWQPTGAGHRGHGLMLWARDHLPDDAVVVIPPYMNRLVCAFRYFGRRRVLGSWKDGGEGTFDLDYQLRWERELRAITGVGDRIRVPDGEVPYGDWFTWQAEAHRRYHAAAAAHFRAVADRFGATHVLREAEADTLQLPEVYRDVDYVLYRCGLGRSGR